MGSRLFYLGRCLTEGLNRGRAVVLTQELESTLEMLRPFKMWGNCTIEDLEATNNKRMNILYYKPMDSTSLRREKSMPGIGALYPIQFKKYGYWWWKAQEISYALRPSAETLLRFHEKQQELKLGNFMSTAVIQVRRTDKTQGCSKIYGKLVLLIQLEFLLLCKGRKSGVKCKSEANAPKVTDFLSTISDFASASIENVLVITDDAEIKQEIDLLETNFTFLSIEPAPRRIVDKVSSPSYFKFCSNCIIIALSSGEERGCIQASRTEGCTRHPSNVTWKSIGIHI